MCPVNNARGDGDSGIARQFNAHTLIAHVPGRLCTTGKKNSFQVAGRVLINPVLYMKLANTIVAFGVVE